MDVADIVFVGGGFSTTATLIELFGKLLCTPGTQKLKITIIEKSEELWLGIPYGSRSSVNALSIQCVHDFIYEAEKPLFFEWLKANKKDWTFFYREQGGVTAARWLDKNLSLIEKEDWEAVYIPRFIFGKYFLEKFTGLLKTAEEKQLVEIKIIRAEAIDVKIIDGGLHEVVLEYPDKTLSNIISHKLVIAIGSAPVKRMYEGIGHHVVYVNDIYEPSVSQNMNTLQLALSETEQEGDRNVLIIGSNASAIELLYLVEGIGDIRKLINKMVVISPGGLLPDHISNEVIARHAIPNLDKINAEGNYTLKTLVDAAALDIKLAMQNGVNEAYLATIITHALKLLEILGEDAKKEFIGVQGMKLSHIFRRSGPDYKYGSQLLIDLQKVILLKGRYLNAYPSGKGALLNYLDTDTGQDQTYPLNFKVIINCTGSDNLVQSSSRLIYNLISRHICTVNISGKAFEVNEKFETAPNLYIMGPLLGGNMNKLIHFWHLENAPRLMYLAPYLANILLHDRSYSRVE